jgi:hypothetical protein
MLDMGFIPDIERIVKLIPFTRQTLFFSATMPPEITRLADQFLHSPVRVEVSRAASTATTVTQRSRRLEEGFREARRAARPDPQPGKPEERHHLLQSQARCRGTVPLARPARFLRRRAAWRHGPALAHGDARRLQGQQDPVARRLRRRRARPRHSRCQPRLQFRRADPCRGLCPPHRPHRPRRPRGRRLHAGLQAGDEASRSDREADHQRDRMAGADSGSQPPTRTRATASAVAVATRARSASAARIATIGGKERGSRKHPAPVAESRKPKEKKEQAEPSEPKRQTEKREAARTVSASGNAARAPRVADKRRANTPVGFGEDIPAFMMNGQSGKAPPFSAIRQTKKRAGNARAFFEFDRLGPEVRFRRAPRPVPAGRRAAIRRIRRNRRPMTRSDC